MLRELIVTKDGSQSISVPELNVSYHSIHGAITESMHVFIDAGLKYALQLQHQDRLNVFEMGFGTGLNAFLTFLQAPQSGICVYYETVETNPLTPQEYLQLVYADILSPENKENFLRMHTATWDGEAEISQSFILKKILNSLVTYTPDRNFDLVFFDAFAPLAQPELWTQSIFENVYTMMNPGGILVTYCSKGDVRRAMMGAGFVVEKLQGPPGKKEMLRAVRPRQRSDPDGYRD